MSSAAKKVLSDALALSELERMELMTALSDSFEPSASALAEEWRTEIDDRIGQLARAEVQPVSWEQVEAKISETLARRR